MGFGVWGLGFGVWGLGFGVWGFRVWGLGFGVEDLGSPVTLLSPGHPFWGGCLPYEGTQGIKALFRV